MGGSGKLIGPEDHILLVRRPVLSHAHREQQQICTTATRRVGVRLPLAPVVAALERGRGAMALAIGATVRVDSRRATVHWHNEHDKAQEVARQADTHEVAQDVLCHELRALEVRYGKLEGLIQRLVGLVQRDCPALLLEFMERGASQADATHDPEPTEAHARHGPEPMGAEAQVTLAAVPAACWEVLASKPQRGQSMRKQGAAHDGMARHKGVGFGGPRVERIGGVLWLGLG